MRLCGSRWHFKLKPAVRRELTGHPFGDRPKMPLRLRLKLNMSGERLDAGVLKGD